MLANGQNSFNCSEESCNNPFADSIITFESIYSLCSEEAGNMQTDDKGRFVKGMIPWNKGGIKGYRNGKVKIPTLCACGCNEVVWGGNIYINGHAPQGYFKKGEHKSPHTEFKKGQTPWIKGKSNPSAKNNPHLFRKGQLAWNKGIPRTEDEKQKMSIGRKGKHIGKNHHLYRKHLPDTIKKRLSELGKARIGDKASNWKGGLSFEPYCPKFNNQLKEQIRDRDNRTCQLCGVEENGRKLDVHHVHYDKPNCNPDLIALCAKCNVKVNGNRDHWENYFMQKLMERRLL